jgi:gluconate 2-dehydrogenase gamma chain
MPKDSDSRISRRTVMASAALVPFAAIQSAAAPDSVFSPAQRRTLEAFMDRLVPSDENGPGASECGAANYIDASLGDFLAAEKTAFLDGLKAIDDYARSKHDAAFADLAPDKQDLVATAIESNSRPFFERVRRLTLEGMMSDPHYGGNTAFRGWDLIRYPGPRLAVSTDDQKIKDALKPVRISAYGGSHGH